MQRIKAHVPADIGLEVFVCHKLTLIGDAEPELAVGHRAAGQSLGGNDLSGGAARRVGRSAVTVVERHQGLLDLVLATLVDRLMRALGTAGNGRRSSERAGGVVGDGDRHRAHGVVVGVTGLAVVLLGHGVRKGLAGVSQRKYNLMTSQNVDQSDRCLCRCGGLEAISPGQQTERASRSVVSRCHGKGELTLGHGAAVQILAEPQTAGSGVVKLSAVRVGKASAFLLGDVGGQLALAVLGHGHFGGRDMSVIRHACRIARVLADLILVGSGSRVADLAEVDGGDAVLRVLLAHGHGCGVGQRGALGGGDGKAELVPLSPLSAVNGLAQAKVELCIERGHAVGVLEGRRRGALQLVRSAEGTVTVVGNGGLDGVLGVAVRDALAGGSAVDLAQRVGVLAGLGVLHGTHRDLAVGGVGALGDDLGIFALALDELEGELAILEVAAVQDLGHGNLVGDAKLVRIRLVAVVELRFVVALQLVLCHEFALAVVGDGRLDGVGLAVVSDAVVGVTWDLAQRVGVLAGLVVGDLAHRDLAVGGIGAGGDDLAALDELEGELAFLEIAPGQDLGRLDLVGDAGVIRSNAVGILEDSLLDVLQLMLNRELAIAIIGDGGHDGVGRGAVGDTVVGVDLDLAQRVGVLVGLGVGDLVHRDLAVGRIGAPGDDIVTLDELKGELSGLEVAAGQDLLRGDLVGNAGLVRGSVVLVLKARRLGALERMGHLKRAVAVIDDARLDGVVRLIVRNPVAQPRFVGELLAQLVGVSAGLIVSDFVHDDCAIGGVGAGSDDLVALDELEGELAILEIAAGQDLGRGDLFGDARLDRRHVIGIGEREGRITVRLAGYAQIPLAVIGHGEGNLARRLSVVGHASDLTGLGHGVGKGVLAPLGLLAHSLVKVVERKGNLAKVDLAVDVVVHARARRHRRALFTGHGKGELAGNISRSQAVGDLQVLDARKRGLGSIRGVDVLELDALDVLGIL